MVRRVKTKDVVEILGSRGSGRLPLPQDVVFDIVDYRTGVKNLRFVLKEYIQGTEK